MKTEERDMNDVTDQHDPSEDIADDEVRARREFLKKCGKYAVVVPPAMALLLTRDANAVPCDPSGNPTGCYV